MRIKALVLACSAVLAVPAAAPPVMPCLPTQDMEAGLIDWHGEYPVSKTQGGLHIWASGLGGTWTLLDKRPDGISCTLAYGSNWIPGVTQTTLISSLASDAVSDDTAVTLR